MARSPTIMWCNQCEAWTPCRSLITVADGVETGDVGKFEFNDGTHGFRRMRSCEDCGEQFATLEMDEATLVQRDKVLQSIKKAVAKLK